MLGILDRLSQEIGRTRNEIVVLSMEFALQKTEIKIRKAAFSNLTVSRNITLMW